MQRAVRHEKLVYHTLNMFQIHDQATIQIGRCWCPVNRVDDVKQALINVAVDDQPPNVCIELETDDARPPYLRTNKYTAPFQGIVDT